MIDEHGAPSHTLVERIKGFYMPSKKVPQVLRGETLAISILRGDWLYFPSLAWRAETILGIGFREGYDVVQDMALVCDVAMKGGGLLYDPIAAFLYRRHSGSDSSWRALEGTRFEEERRYYNTMVEEMSALGWKKAARVARIRFSSRAHALTLLPKAALAKKWQGVKNLAEHVVK